ncbi:hypothetical protein ACFX1T_026125 [Malus domestica]
MEISSSSLPILPCNFHFLSAADPPYKLLQTHRSLTLLQMQKHPKPQTSPHTHHQNRPPQHTLFPEQDHRV